MIIGLAGKAGAGKSTVADALVMKGFQRDAYAKTMKEAISIIFGIPLDILRSNAAVKSQIDPYWGMSYRQIMQLFGTEACRKTFGGDIWERVLWNRHTYVDYDLVIDDVRFPNEAEAILDRGGQVWEIVRGKDSKDTHSSETPLPRELITLVVGNYRAIEDLQKIVFELIK